MQTILELEQDTEFNDIIKDIISNDTVLQMKNYITIIRGRRA